MCCIIEYTGPLCLYPRLVGPLRPQRKCILLLFMPRSMFVPRQDPLLWIYLYPQVYAFLKKIHSQSLCLTIFHLLGNILWACQSLGCHILALELDMEVFMKCWNLSLKQPCMSLMSSMFIVLILILLLRNVRGGCLIVSILSICINIMHSPNDVSSNETLKNVQDLFLSLGGDHWVYEPVGWS